MKSKFSAVLLLSCMLSAPVMAGLPEAVGAFEAQNYEAAYPELLALANEGNSVASYYLGKMYSDGLGTTADKVKAIRYFEQADKASNPDAAVELGKMALKGEGTVQNAELGLQYLKKAAYAGSENALYELGKVYEEGVGVEKNYTYAFGFYYMGALKGDKRAQLVAARYYLNGRGIPQDFNAAMKWYVRAANQGYIPAQEEWAETRVSNKRLQSLLDAYSWYSILAAYNSDEVGQRAAAKRDQIGSKFDSNVLTSQQKKIMNWRPVPADKSVPAAERRAAVIPVIPGYNDEATIKSRLDTGVGLDLDGSAYGINGNMIESAVTTKNRAPIEQLIEQAASKGRVQAYGYYGDLLRARFDDDAGSVIWYRKGAEADDVYSQYQLGKAYCEGRGINPPDVSTCYGWLLQASQKADNNLALTINSALKSIEAEALPEELEKGRQFQEELVKTQEAKKAEDKPKAPGLFNLF